MLKSDSWGRTLVQVDDPEGEDISDDQLNHIELIPNFPKIPATLWSPWINLVFHYCPEDKPTAGPHNYVHGAQLEVECLLLRNAKKGGGVGPEWKMVVPRQTVSVVSVDAQFADNCDIVTGEIYTEFPPPGYVHVGSTHSHNTMKAFFSAIDDAWELSVPGVHIVVGKVDPNTGEYEAATSIVLAGQRKYLTDIDEIVDTDDLGSPFHPNVLDFVEKAKPKRLGYAWGPTLIDWSEFEGMEEAAEVDDEFAEFAEFAESRELDGVALEGDFDESDEIELISEEEFQRLLALEFRREQVAKRKALEFRREQDKRKAQSGKRKAQSGNISNPKHPW